MNGERVAATTRDAKTQDNKVNIKYHGNTSIPICGSKGAEHTGHEAVRQ
jgi:hypothetical protein